MATCVRIGNITITAIRDIGPLAFPASNVFSDMPEDGWDSRPHHLNKAKEFPTNFSVFLVQSADSTMIVDAGGGPGPHEALGGAEGQLMNALATHGVSPEDIDHVFFSHLHFDHIGWALRSNPGAESTPTFPNARYVISTPEWKHWTQPDVLSSSPVEQAIYPLERMGLVDLTDDETPVATGMRAIATPGHTPGHQSLLVESEGEIGFIAGDVLHNTVQFEMPDLCADFDEDKATARVTRRTVLEKLAAERTMTTFGHLLIDSNIGHVIKVEDRYSWQPV
ncbi:MAG: MBL fold metallo-hydrolase [Chloroflexi bacterium]|nr:MBL fold metallo-hydrolase [Chloroflexota bacterium]